MYCIETIQRGEKALEYSQREINSTSASLHVWKKTYTQYRLKSIPIQFEAKWWQEVGV